MLAWAAMVQAVLSVLLLAMHRTRTHRRARCRLQLAVHALEVQCASMVVTAAALLAAVSRLRARMPQASVYAAVAAARRSLARVVLLRWQQANTQPELAARSLSWAVAAYALAQLQAEVRPAQVEMCRFAAAAQLAGAQVLFRLHRASLAVAMQALC